MVKPSLVAHAEREIFALYPKVFMEEPCPFLFNTEGGWRKGVSREYARTGPKFTSPDLKFSNPDHLGNFSTREVKYWIRQAPSQAKHRRGG